MKTNRLLFSILLLGMSIMGCKQATVPVVEAPLVSTPDAKITAAIYDSKFEHSHDTYNGMGAASDGKIY